MSNKFNTLIDEKLNEQKNEIAALKTSDKKGKSTQLHMRRREQATLKLIQELLNALPDGHKLSEDGQKTLVSLTTLKSERAVYEKIVVKAGDNFMELVQRYDRKDVAGKIKKAAEDAGLTIDWTTGVIA